MSKHEAIQSEFLIFGAPEKVQAQDDFLTIQMDPYRFHRISINVESAALARDLADAMNTVLARHRALAAPALKAG